VTRGWAWVAVGAWLLGCGPGDGDSTPSTSTGASTGESTSATDGETGLVDCEDPKVVCDNQCVDLRWDEDHCGECGHTCKQTGAIGQCHEAECTPRNHCVLREEPYATCAEVCRRDGTVCSMPRDDHEKWAAGHYGLYYGSTGENRCLALGGSDRSLVAECDDPIDWTMRGGWNATEPVAARCLCNQP
jgi:hypothetical protein